MPSNLLLSNPHGWVNAMPSLCSLMYALTDSKVDTRTIRVLPIAPFASNADKTFSLFSLLCLPHHVCAFVCRCKFIPMCMWCDIKLVNPGWSQLCAQMHTFTQRLVSSLLGWISFVNVVACGNLRGPYPVIQFRIKCARLFELFFRASRLYNYSSSHSPHWPSGWRHTLFAYFVQHVQSLTAAQCLAFVWLCHY